MADHDGGYKLLFGNQRMVEDLVRGFVPEPWVDRLDFSTLQLCDGSYVTEGHRRLEQDMVWRVEWKGEATEGEGRRGERSWLYVYLLLEFQSRVERFMAVRMLNYLSLLYLDLVKHRELTQSGKLPPVLPLVLYNGERRWSAPRQVSELIETVPGGLTVYRPSLEYLLIYEGRLSDEELASEENLVAALFRLEESREPRRARDLVDALARRLQGAGKGPLRRAFARWLHKVLLPKRFPGVEIPEMESLEDAQTMLRQRVIEWDRRVEELKEAGLREGLQEGRRKGLQEGRRELLLRLMERKFGTVDPAARRRIEDAEDRQLLAWGENLLTADTLEDVFAVSS
jgi:predicted transposase YdaD